MATTTIYIVRHAHSDWTGDHNDNGRPLSDAGVEAAKVLAARLASFPITAIYSSPYRRSVDTVVRLAERLNVRLELVPNLRERELPVVPAGEFHRLVENAWRSPAESVEGGESNIRAQARGLDVMRTVLERHQGQQVVLATHGNLLALIVNGLDSVSGYEFWRRLSLPDIYRLEFDAMAFVGMTRMWEAAVSPAAVPDERQSVEE
ncbi:MAG TPA: histidine phosphatase family protein [Vicinamibacterales bacterium]|nr:histidine phosphatase family protein [Vicinamibacterales bacterium]